MFLGRNRSLNDSGSMDKSEFLNQANRPMPNGMQRFLAKKGINSSNDLFGRIQNSPRMPFRKAK